MVFSSRVAIFCESSSGGGLQVIWCPCGRKIVFVVATRCFGQQRLVSGCEIMFLVANGCFWWRKFVFGGAIVFLFAKVRFWCQRCNFSEPSCSLSRAMSSNYDYVNSVHPPRAPPSNLVTLSTSLHIPRHAVALANQRTRLVIIAICDSG